MEARNSIDRSICKVQPSSFSFKLQSKAAS
jgi:hypothetical protein